MDKMLFEDFFDEVEDDLIEDKTEDLLENDVNITIGIECLSYLRNNEISKLKYGLQLTIFDYDSFTKDDKKRFSILLLKPTEATPKQLDRLYTVLNDFNTVCLYIDGKAPMYNFSKMTRIEFISNMMYFIDIKLDIKKMSKYIKDDLNLSNIKRLTQVFVDNDLNALIEIWSSVFIFTYENISDVFNNSIYSFNVSDAKYARTFDYSFTIRPTDYSEKIETILENVDNIYIDNRFSKSINILIYDDLTISEQEEVLKTCCTKLKPFLIR